MELSRNQVFSTFVASLVAVGIAERAPKAVAQPEQSEPAVIVKKIERLGAKAVKGKATVTIALGAAEEASFSFDAKTLPDGKVDLGSVSEIDELVSIDGVNKHMPPAMAIRLYRDKQGLWTAANETAAIGLYESYKASVTAGQLVTKQVMTASSFYRSTLASAQQATATVHQIENDALTTLTHASENLPVFMQYNTAANTYKIVSEQPPQFNSQ